MRSTTEAPQEGPCEPGPDELLLRRLTQRWAPRGATAPEFRSSGAARADEREGLELATAAARQAERRVEALLRSRRWRAGAAAGDVLDRLVPGRGEGGDRARELRVAANTAVASLERLRAATVGERNSPSDPRDVDEWLRTAPVGPILPAPFDEGGVRVLAWMDQQRRRLRRIHATRTDIGLVSVVMPTYDRAHLLPRAMASVLQQSHRELELIVVDDGSTDDTRSVLAGVADPRVRAFHLPRNGGVAAARNHALRHARGDLIAYLDSDNRWDPDHLSILAGTLEAAPGRESAYCGQSIWDVGMNGARLRGVRFAPFHRAMVENRNSIDLNAFVHRDSLVQRYGGFDTSLTRLVDWDLLLRYTVESRPLAVPCVLSHYEFGRATDQLTDLHPPGPATATLDASFRGDHVAAPSRFGRLFGLRHQPAPAERHLTVVVLGDGDVDVVTSCRTALERSTEPRAGDVVVVRDGASGAGLAGALRSGVAAAADGRDVVLLAATWLVTPGWSAALSQVLDDVVDAGVVVGRHTRPAASPDAHWHVRGGQYKPDRELDVASSARYRNVVNPTFDDLRGYVELSYAAAGCYLLRADVVLELARDLGDDDIDLTDRDLCDAVRHSLGRRVLYTPHAKGYDLS